VNKSLILSQKNEEIFLKVDYYFEKRNLRCNASRLEFSFAIFVERKLLPKKFHFIFLKKIGKKSNKLSNFI